MEKHEFLEEMIAASVRTFKIPETDVDNFTDTVLDMLDAIRQSGLEYTPDVCRMDFDAYISATSEAAGLTRNPTKDEQAELAAYTAGFVSAMEYCHRNPELHRQMKEALLKNMRN